MNQLLTQTKAALMQRLDPKIAPAVQKVADAGKAILLSDQTRDMVSTELAQAKDPESIGSSVAKLAAVLVNQAKGTIPPQVLFPAAMELLLEALDFLEEAGTVKVTPDFLAQCSQALGSAFLQSMGVTPEKLAQLSAGQDEPAAEEPPPAPAGIVGAAMGGA